jgi:hypothetical protein
MRRLGFVLAACFFFLLPMAQAQIGLYGEFSAPQSDAPSTGWFYGPTFGAYVTPIHMPVLNLGLDFRGKSLNNGSGNIFGGMAGPRGVIHLPAVPIKPYAEGLVGVAHYNVGHGIDNQTGTSVSYGWAGGVDLTFLPRLDWRAFEYAYMRVPDLYGGTNFNSLSTGIVLRIPFL